MAAATVCDAMRFSARALSDPCPVDCCAVIVRLRHGAHGQSGPPCGCTSVVLTLVGMLHLHALGCDTSGMS